MKKKIISLLTVLFALTACGGMDENYSQYLEEIPTYSPAVSALSAVSPEPGTLVLSWTLPAGELAQSVEIVLKASSSEEKSVELGLITTHTFTGLELQGYEFSVYTKDVFGNRSIPVTHTFTPIPGREG
jgi:hypothetical protein